MEKDFLLDRYRFILDQKKWLNRSTFTIVSIFQAGLALVVSGQYVIGVAVSEGKVGFEWGRLAASGLFCLLLVLSSSSISMIVSGAVAWLGYRREEAEIEVKVFGAARSMPQLRNILYWFETYIVLAIVLITIGYGVFFVRIFQEV